MFRSNFELKFHFEPNLKHNLLNPFSNKLTIMTPKLEFSIKNDMKGYFSNAKAFLFDSPLEEVSEDVIESYFENSSKKHHNIIGNPPSSNFNQHHIGNKIQEKHENHLINSITNSNHENIALDSQKISLIDHQMISSSNVESLNKILDNGLKLDGEIYQKILREPSLIKSKIIKFLPENLIPLLSPYDKDVEFFQFYSKFFHEYLSGTPKLRNKMNNLLFEMESLMRDEKLERKFWIPDCFGIQYYSIWEPSLKYMLNQDWLSTYQDTINSRNVNNVTQNQTETNLEESNTDYHLKHIGSFQLLKCIQRLSKENIAVILCHGGYFAGGIWKNGTCTIHKTFHRYVVRKKQGKRQVSQDKSKKARSVGSEIRRLNEIHFKEKLIQVMNEWKSDLDSCNIILLSAPGPINRSYLFGETFLNEDDKRLTSIPIHLDGSPNFETVKEIYTSFTSLGAVYANTPPKTIPLTIQERKRLFTIENYDFEEWMNEENN